MLRSLLKLNCICVKKLIKGLKKEILLEWSSVREDEVSWKDSVPCTNEKVEEFRWKGRSRRDHTADGLSARFKQQNTNQCFSVTCMFSSNDEILNLSPTKNFMNKYSFSLRVSGEKSFYYILSKMVWTVWCTRCFSLLKIFLALQCGKHIHTEKKGREIEAESDGCQRVREAHRTPLVSSVWDLGPWDPLDGSQWMGALVRWPGSLRTGYEGKGMLLLCIWPRDPLSNVCLGSFETQHIYLQRSEERGWSGCQNKVIVLLTASSAVEGQLWQAHNVAASASPEQRTVICGHAGNLETTLPLPSSLDTPELCL